VDASQKGLVVFGSNLRSTVGEKYTRKELVIVRLGPYPRYVIVGLVLSDGWLIIVSKGSNNVRLELFSLQLIIWWDGIFYLYFFFLCLSHCCSSYHS